MGKLYGKNAFYLTARLYSLKEQYPKAVPSITIGRALDTIAARPQDPYYIREEDKKVIRTKLFPFWKGKSLSEACDVELKRPAC